MNLHTGFKAIGRLALVIATSLGASTYSNYKDYEAYWTQTIFRVQTVDFNILSHTLPTKLSWAMLRGDKKEIQRTLDSNFGLSGLVITDCIAPTSDPCLGEKILFSTNSNRNWKQQLRVEHLSRHPFDLLYDPPPVKTEASFDGPRDTVREATGLKNPGRILGRVYYVRGIPPTFTEDFGKWLAKPSSTSGAHSDYASTTTIFALGGFAVWLMIEWFDARRRAQMREHEATKAQLKQQLSQVSDLISEKEKLVATLDKLEQLQAQQFTLPLAPLQPLNHQVQSFHTGREESSTQTKEKNNGNAQPLLIQELHTQIGEFKQREMESHLQRETMERSLIELRQQKQRLEEQLSVLEEPDLNAFERKLLNLLKATPQVQAQTWLVHPHLDVKRGKGIRQFVDLLVIGKGWVIVIEAKNYDGKIKAAGYPKISAWFNWKNEHRGKIQSSHGRNPYEQVNTYADSLMKSLKNETNAKRITVYGIVVFADKADITSVSSEIGGFTRVTTMSQLIQVISELEQLVKVQGNVQRSCHQIEDLVFGRQMRKQD